MPRLKFLPWMKKDKTPSTQGCQVDNVQASLNNDLNERHGMFTFEDKNASDASAIDIVAIHGLNGHYEKTWSSPAAADGGSDVNWLKELLPKQVSNARVMSFGYNSALQFSKSTADTYTFADQLLEALMSKRGSDIERQRPIMFICHSLGGIVAKQAINRAHERERYRSLLEQTFGIAFFGTPHNGSSIASWSTILASILSAVSLGTSTNTQISKDLERHSRILENISRSFVERGQRLDILSFYELEKIDLFNFKVVDESSAILHWPNEVTIPVNGNHRTMCRFSKLDEQKYLNVGSNISKMAHKGTRAATPYKRGFTEEEEQLHSEFHTTSYEYHQDRNPHPIPGTCTWILDHAQYRQWLATKSPVLLWLSADPGCGKSVLTSYLITHTKQNILSLSSPQANVCYFFFKADNDEQRHPINALSAILHQIYDAQPNLITHAVKRLKIPGNNRDKFNTMWKIFVDTIEDHELYDTLIFIDGLDECEQIWGKLFVRSIADYFKKSEVKNSAPCLKMFIASRPDNSIKSSFDTGQAVFRDAYYDELYVTDEPEANTNIEHEIIAKSKKNALEAIDRNTTRNAVSMIRLRGEDETDPISGDVKLVVGAAMQSMTHSGIPSEIMLELQKELIKRADRTFLWTTLIISLLKERSEAGASRRELADILKSRDIDSIYTNLLANRGSPFQVRKLLNIILAAFRPLTLDELNVAMTIVPDHNTSDASLGKRLPGTTTFKDLALDLIYPFENYIKSLCGHFLRIIRGKVYLVHETAREYLLFSEAKVDKLDFAEPLTMFEDDILSNTEAPDQLSCTPPLVNASEMGDRTSQSSMILNGDQLDSAKMEHSFSMLVSHALLLELCVTYIYYLGKEPKYTTANMDATQNQTVGSFLKYAANYWTEHFEQARELVPDRTITYYQVLCHPLFPGFRIWLDIRGYSKEEEPYSLTGDTLQDYYLETFGIHSALEDDEVRNNASHPPVHLPTSSIAAFSSSPDDLSNYNFPLAVDNTGFVSLKRMT